ncbi:DUF2169 domain-containing protein [Desulfonauticus submarinus]
MRVIKDIHHGLLLNRFEIENKYYLVISILIFFDFDKPNCPLSEQEMWKFVQSYLGKEAILDSGMPKIKGEIIVYGSCFPPEGTAKVSTVGFGIKGIRKKLAVFGDRFWERKGGISIISEPRPFKEMPITWDRAFGGKEYKMNPLGKGIDPVILPNGREIFPLPNLEDPDHLIGSPGDRPNPICFAPIDMMWPQRFKKQGTYDKKWLRERWPFYPEDMDWSFFNCASEDQQRDGFFRGGEEFFIENMHPERPKIVSQIPALRQKCFVNKLKELDNPEGETLFQEVENKIDTLILFPHALKGIALWRGTVEVLDDEALDVLHIFVATENLLDNAKDIDYYYKIFQKKRKGEIDDLPEVQEAEVMLKKAEKELEIAKKQLKELPKKINDSILRGLGERPKQSFTPNEIIKSALENIENAEQFFGKTELDLQGLREEFGHIVKIESINMKNTMQENIGKIKETVKTFGQKLNAINKNVQASKEEIKSKFEAGLKGGIKDKIVEIKDFLDFLDKKEDPWLLSGMKFLQECRLQLLKDKEKMEILTEIGFSDYTVKWAWLGFNQKDRQYKGRLWGLDQEEIFIPKGLVIPYFEKDTLKKLVIRPDIVPDNSKDVLVSGSKEKNYLLSTAVVEGIVVVVKEEFEALLLHQEIWDIASVVVVSNPKEEVDKNTESLLQQASCILIPEYSVDYIQVCKEKFSQLDPIVMPDKINNIILMKSKNIDLRKWFLSVIRPDIKKELIDLAKAENINLEEEFLFSFDLVSKKVNNVIKKDTNTEKIEELKNLKNEIIANIKDKLRKIGVSDKTLEDITKDSEESKRSSEEFISSAREKLSHIIKKTRIKLESSGFLTENSKKILEEIENTHLNALQNAQVKLQDAKQKIQNTEELFSKTDYKPNWAKELIADNIKLKEYYEKLTREKVIELYNKGESLAGKDISGLDLSRLHLDGADFSSSLLEGTIFKESSLNNANFSKAIASNTDFSNASLENANLEKGIFDNAKFINANLRGACLREIFAEKADFEGADISKADLQGISFIETKLKGIKGKEIKADGGVFLQVEASKGIFAGADFKKALFSKASLEESDFSESKVCSTIFTEVKANKTKFIKADLYNSRIINKSDFSESDFVGAKANRSCWMKSKLSDSDFKGSLLDQTLVQECDVSRSSLRCVCAKKARFERSDFSKSDMEGINLFQGSLRKARLNNTNLKKANLYGVEFYKTKVKNINLEKTNLKKTKLEGREQTIHD